MAYVRESKRTEAERENHEMFLRDQSFALSSSSSWRTPSSRAPSSIAALPCLPPATRRPHPRLISASKTIRRSLGPGRIRREEQTAPPKSGHQEVRRAERRDGGRDGAGRAGDCGGKIIAHSILKTSLHPSPSRALFRTGDRRRRRRWRCSG